MLDGDADRAGAADEQGTFIHQLQVTGLLMYHLAEHRKLREPVVVSVNNTSMAARLGEHYGIEVHETPVGFKFIGPEMIATGAMLGAEESGGFGFGMHLPERDGIYADLMLLELFLAEKAAGRWPVSKAIAQFHEIAGPSFYRRIDVHVDRALYDETKRRLLVDLREQAPTDARRPADRPDGAARHERRVQVLPRRRDVAPDPGERHGAAGPGLHRGDLGRRCARRCSSPASAWSAARDATARAWRVAPRRVDKPWGHELIWALTDRYCGKVIMIETGRRLSLQYHEQKDEAILVLSGRLLLHLEDDAGELTRRELGAGDAAQSRSAGVTATRRSSGSSSSRSRRPELGDVVRRRGRLRPRGHVQPVARTGEAPST